MLTIDRKIGEEVYVGNVKVTIKDVKDRSAIVNIGKTTSRIKHGQSATIGETELLLIKIFRNKVRLGFDCPRSVLILRGELKDKDIEKTYSDNAEKELDEQYQDIDNSTKDFPSGNF